MTSDRTKTTRTGTPRMSETARDVATATEAVLSVCDPAIRQAYADAVAPDDILAWAPGALSRDPWPEPPTVQAIVDAVTPLVAEARREGAVQATAKIRELHRKEYRTTADEVWGHTGYCAEDGHAYPCDTITSLDAIEAGEDPK